MSTEKLGVPRPAETRPLLGERHERAARRSRFLCGVVICVECTECGGCVGSTRLRLG